MNVCFLGKLGDAALQWAENIAHAGFSLQFLNTHLSRQDCDPGRHLIDTLGVTPFHLYEDHSFPYGLKSRLEIIAYEKGLRRRRPAHWGTTADRLAAYLEERQPDLILAWWGYDLYYEFYLLFQALQIDIPVIHVLNTYPANTQGWFMGEIETYFYRMFHDKIRARVFYSAEMKAYYEEKIGPSAADLVAPEPYLRKYFHAAEHPAPPVLERRDDRPHIAFTGRTDFSSALSQRKDDLRRDIARIAAQGIHVYMRSSAVIEESEMVHFYPAFTSNELLDGTFAAYLHQFDGILAIYNEFGSKIRYTTSLATRFAHSLTACVPLIARDTSLCAKTLFAEHHNGFTYRDESDMKRKLEDRAAMRELKEQAKMNIDRFSFERCEPAFVRLVEEAVGGAKRQESESL